MEKDTARLHRSLVGYEVCIHICGCKRRRASPLWPREGGSCSRHSQNQRNHPRCNSTCPGYSAGDTNASRTSRTRDPTRQEVIDYLSPDEAKVELQRLWLAPLQPIEPHDQATSGPMQNTDPEADVIMKDGETVVEDSEDEIQVEVQLRQLTPDDPLAISKSLSVSGHECYPAVASEIHALQILYVPDPTHELKRSDAEKDLGWTLRYITFEQFDAIKNLSGFVYKHSQNRKGVRMLVTEWLWMLLRMDSSEEGGAFDIHCMKWEEFRDIVLDPPTHPEGWSKLTLMDCIIGGIDYSVEHRSDRNPYGLDERMFTTYEAHIDQLTSMTQFWPPIELARLSASKWKTSCHLQMIAKIRGLYAPATRVLTPGEDIPPSTVLKRSHSNRGSHIVLPAAGACNRTWDHLNAQISEDTVWMAQEYVQSLDEDRRVEGVNSRW
ncbi:hypothetical protein HD554DRAFT_1008650 [Boletus coccyginus]|nr:hypothetical protein HD554DRAFT_1008650 [Boletus coccyginus]